MRHRFHEDDPQRAAMADALDRAIQHAGGTGLLAEKIGIRSQSITRWKNNLGYRVPVDRVLAVESAVDGAVKRHELRPDIYPPPRGGRKPGVG